jgi:ankyrin repeat protein
MRTCSYKETCDNSINLLKQYGVTSCDRKSCDKASALKEYRQSVLKLHPDKGGDAELFKEFQNAKEDVIDNECYKGGIKSIRKKNVDKGNTPLMDMLYNLSPAGSVQLTTIGDYYVPEELDPIITYIRSTDKEEINKANNLGYTPFLYSVKLGYLQLIRELIEAGADVNYRYPKTGRTALMENISPDSQYVSSLFKINEANYSGLDLISLELIKYTDLNIVDYDGNTALSLVLEKNNKNDIIISMISQGADANIQDSMGNTFLMRSIMKGDLKLVRRLVEVGVDMDIKNVDGLTAFDLCTGVGQQNEFCDALVLPYYTIHFNENDGDTLLMAYAYLGKTHIIDKLMKYKKNKFAINKPNVYGQTMLHYAALGCNKELMDYLHIQYGADPSLQDNYGLKASDIYLRKCVMDSSHVLSNIKEEGDIQKIFSDS